MTATQQTPTYRETIAEYETRRMAERIATEGYTGKLPLVSNCPPEQQPTGQEIGAAARRWGWYHNIRWCFRHRHLAPSCDPCPGCAAIDRCRRRHNRRKYRGINRHGRRTEQRRARRYPVYGPPAPKPRPEHPYDAAWSKRPARGTYGRPGRRLPHGFRRRARNWQIRLGWRCGCGQRAAWGQSGYRMVATRDWSAREFARCADCGALWDRVNLSLYGFRARPWREGKMLEARRLRKLLNHAVTPTFDNATTTDEEPQP